MLAETIRSGCGLSWRSLCLQFLQARQRESAQRGKFRAQHFPALARCPIGITAVFSSEWLDQTLLLQPRDRPLYGPRAQPRSTHGKDVLDHRMAVFRSVRQARQYE